MDEDYLILPKDEPFFYQDDLNLCDPEGTAFPAPYIGELGLLHPTTLGGDDAEPEEAAAPSFPQFIGDLSAQPPPPTPGGSVKAAPQFIGDDVSAQPPYHNGAGEGSGLPPAMSSGMEEAAHLAPSNAPLHPFDDVFDLLEPFDEVPRPEETEELFAYALELDKGNDDQWILGAAHLDANPNQTPCSLLSQFDADSLLGTNHQTAIHNSAAATHQLVQEIPSSDTPPARAAADAMEMAELSRVADECGGEASMVWSSDEDELLLDGFSRYACAMDDGSIDLFLQPIDTTPRVYICLVESFHCFSDFEGWPTKTVSACAWKLHMVFPRRLQWMLHCESDGSRLGLFDTSFVLSLFDIPSRYQIDNMLHTLSNAFSSTRHLKPF